MESKQTRLFIGNLLPAISNSALQAALSKFGTVKDLSRNDDRNFAHASVCPSDDKAIGKCISVLNQTRWFGTVLRVEIAAENFQSRLAKEWAEEEEAGRLLKVAALAARRKKGNGEWRASKSDVPDRFSWKGKRTTFYSSAEDARAANASARVGEDDGGVPSMSENASRRKKMAKMNQTETCKGSQVAKPVSKPVAATLDLFGLNAAAADEDVEMEVEKPSPAKRARSKDEESAAKEKERSLMQAIEDDPSKMDVPAEKNLALSIVEKMFSFGGSGRESAGRLEDDVKRHRRKALYRKMLGDTMEDTVLVTSLKAPNFGSNNQDVDSHIVRIIEDDVDRQSTERYVSKTVGGYSRGYGPGDIL